MDTITVHEKPDSEVRQDCAEFITEDWREDLDGRLTGHVLMTLTNGRRLFIGRDGIYDRADWPEDEQETTEHPASVNWEELLELLDGWRELARKMKVN